MSLLLDALKKAEKAKDDAKRRAELAGAADADDTARRVRTRNELPDISKPLEMHPEDIPGISADNPVPDAFSTAPLTRPVSEPTRPPPSRQQNADTAPRPRPAAQSGESAPDAQSAQKAAARKVFEAKFREPNPKLPFYITMVVLGAFALGTVVYFWYQLRPPSPLINANPKPPTDEKKGGAAPPQSQAAPPAAPAPNPATAISGLPVQTPAQPPTPSVPVGQAPQVPANAPLAAANPASRQGPIRSGAAAAPVAPQETARPRDRGTGSPARQQTATPAARAPADPSKLSVNRPAPAVNPKIEAGWLAYNQGDLRAALSNYQDMLRDDPANRDALLGMAAIEIRANRVEQAAGYYQTILQANPRDAYAQAGLLALRAQMGDPVQTESRVKNLLATDPEAQILYFTLGNQYAQQGRWPEAQQAYFKAYSAEPENPDFAYNLAVSLDQVRQPRLAVEYYRRALSLAQQRSSSFDQALARNRVQELAR